MNKNVKILSLVLVVVAVAIGVIIWNQRQPEAKKFPDRDFGVADTDQIGRIFLADKKGNTLDLKRQGQDWIVNDEHIAFFNTMDIMLKTLRQVKVKYIPPKAAEEYLIKSLAATGIKVELYDLKGKKMKVFYVGGNTSDDLGTAFIMEGFAQPYVMHLPGMVGGLRSRFELNPDKWIDRWIFKEEFDEIEYVSLEYPGQRSKSFILERKGKKYDIKPFYDITPAIKAEILPAAVEAFLSGFEKIGSEAVINNSPDRDSIAKLIPFVIISLKGKSGEMQELALYPIFDQISEDVRKVDNVQYDTFVERYYAISNNGNFYLVQHLLFGKLLWSYDHFFDMREAPKPILN